HAIRELLDGDGFRDRHLADELFLGLVVRVAFEALHATAERSDRAFTLLAGTECGHKGQTSAPPLGTGSGRLRGRRRPGRSTGPAGGGALGGIGLGRGGFRRLPRRNRRYNLWLVLGLGGGVLGLLLGLSVGVFLVAPAVLLFPLASFRGVALNLLTRLA